jgi:hypothetical protein
MKLTSVAAGDEYEQGNDQGHDGRSSRPQDVVNWRQRGGAELRIRSNSVAAIHQARVHNATLLVLGSYKAMTAVDEAADWITRVRPGLAPNLLEIEDAYLRMIRLELAKYAARGVP